jgi:glycosyltransferase involved in cell wall biosynthesis
MAGRVSGVPIVATVHGRGYYGDRRRRRLAYRMVGRAARMVAVSQDVKRFIVETTRLSDRHVRVIHNGIALPAAVPAAVVDATRAELGLLAGDRVVLAVGSLYEVKGHRFLLEAWPQVLQTCPTAVLLLAGRGDREAALREQARHLGIKARVRFLGLRRDVPVLLQMCEAFVQPSLSEGLSIAILEAMAAGRAVVTTRVGGNPELVVDGETGVLLEPADVPALAAAVGRMLAHPGDARRLGDNGRARVASRFTLEAMVRQYETVYDGAIGRVAPAAPGRVLVGG